MSLDIHLIQEQLKYLEIQRDQHATMFQKCAGAIDILKEQLKMIEDKSRCAVMDFVDATGDIEDANIIEQEPK